MAREPSKLDTILLRVVDRLIAFITEATEYNTYISTVSDRLPPNPDEVMFEVSPSQNFVFDEGVIDGAGRNELSCTTQITVAIHVTHQNDQEGRDKQYLTHADRGALYYIQRVLDALAVHPLTDTNGDFLLSHEGLIPVAGYIPPKEDRNKGVVTLSFKITFDWEVVADIY